MAGNKERMPIRLIDPSKPVKWVHPQDDQTDPTVFHVVALTEGRARGLRSEYLMCTPPDINAFKMAMFLECVKEISNVIMPGDTEARSISASEDIRLFLDCLPVQYVSKLYDAIQNLTDLDAGTVKNSGASHVSPHS